MRAIFYAIFFEFFYTNLCETPIVLWHGMGDSCCRDHSLGFIKSEIEKIIPGVYVYSIRIGSSNFEDRLNGFWYNVNTKIDYVCGKLKKDHFLKNGFHAVGFSQGAQFLRALAQRCGSLRIKNLISLGGQHQGVYGIPNCDNGIICKFLVKLIDYFAYWNIIQKNSVQASYWHDPYDESSYRDKNLFLADINQEKFINLTYKENLMKLEKLVLVKFEKDEMVHPIESQWFGFYEKNSVSKIYTMEDSVLYANDTLGLKSMDQQGKIIKLSYQDKHLKFSISWFKEKIVLPFLKDVDIK